MDDGINEFIDSYNLGIVLLLLLLFFYFIVYV